VPAPIELSPWGWRDYDDAVPAHNNGAELAWICAFFQLIGLFKHYVQVLIEASEDSAEVSAALQLYKDDVSEGFVKKFSCADIRHESKPVKRGVSVTREQRYLTFANFHSAWFEASS